VQVLQLLLQRMQLRRLQLRLMQAGARSPKDSHSYGLIDFEGAAGDPISRPRRDVPSLTTIVSIAGIEFLRAIPVLRRQCR
jgi:hypothetical protein